MDEIKEWFYEIRIEETVRNLVRHGFEGPQGSGPLNGVQRNAQADTS